MDSKQYCEKKKGIIVMGNIGVGKSTWIMNTYRQADIIGEGFERNQWLEWYYKNPQKYAYLVQRMFIDIQKENIMNSLNGNNDLVVFDRGPWDLDIFIEVMYEDGLISEDQFKDLFQLNKQNKKLICQHYDLTLIVIETTMQNIIERIKKRNRPMEQNISQEYLKKLDQKYRRLSIESIQLIKLLN